MANQNKAKNDAARKKWLSEHSPLEIKAANLARDRLRKQAIKDGKGKVYRHIRDERIVKQTRSAYSYFLADRFASGDFRHMKFSEIGPLLGREWKALGVEEKKVVFYPPLKSFLRPQSQTADQRPKVFEDKAAKDRVRYVDEYTTVYGTPPALAKKKGQGQGQGQGSS